MNSNINGLFFILTLFRDVFFVGIMLLSSVYMVILFVQVSEAIPAPSQQHESHSREKSYSDHPAAGDFLCCHVLCGPHHLIFHNSTVGMGPSYPKCPEVCGQFLCHCQSFGADKKAIIMIETMRQKCQQILTS